MLDNDANYYKDAMEKTRRKQAESDPVAKKKAEEDIKRRMLQKYPNYYNDAMKNKHTVMNFRSSIT